MKSATPDFLAIGNACAPWAIASLDLPRDAHDFMVTGYFRQARCAHRRK
ncbi:hypothetical protein [Scytonema sp. PCC 10023]